MRLNSRLDSFVLISNQPLFVWSTAKSNASAVCIKSKNIKYGACNVCENIADGCFGVRERSLRMAKNKMTHYFVNCSQLEVISAI